MAHLVESDGLRPAGLLATLNAALQSAKGLTVRCAAMLAEDGSDLRPTSFEASNRRASSPHCAFSPEVVEHVRSLLENGYIEESSGKRVRVPPYIRSQLTSEFRLLL